MNRIPIFRSRVRPLTIPDFEAVRDLARSACGITLQEQKKAIVSSRLEKLVHRHGFETYTEYIAFIAHRKHCPEFTEFIDALTTNHSGFWREPEHFTFLREKIFPARRNRIRIWSAACATGEEPSTIAMCALEAGIQACSVTASDISRSALGAAVRGVYCETRVAALPHGWRGRHFSAVRNSGSRRGEYVLSSAARALIHYAPLNLLEPFHHLGQFDVIFCRNVMIYFEQSTRDDLVKRLSERLTEGGHLFTGHSETLLRLPSNLQYVQPATYRKLA